LHELVFVRVDGLTEFVSLEVAKVTNMADCIAGATMSCSKWIIVLAHVSTVVRNIAKLVDVDSMDTVRLKAIELGVDDCCFVIVWLLEVDTARDRLSFYWGHHADCSFDFHLILTTLAVALSLSWSGKLWDIDEVSVDKIGIGIFAPAFDLEGEIMARMEFVLRVEF
jgi:hypothetical protein